MKVLLAHPGTQHAPRLAAELDRLGLLDAFWTGVGAVAGTPRAALFRTLRGLPALGGLSTRIVSGFPARKLRTLPGVEFSALWRMKRGGDGEVVFHERNERFQNAIPESALAATDAVIGFDTSAWRLAERCQVLGRRFFLDRSIAHPAAFPPLQARLARLYPTWADAALVRPAFVAAAEETEHRLAERIVVGCEFARQSLVDHGVPSPRVVVNPYGVDWETLAAVPAPPRTDRPLRFLYLGSVIARKGVPVLLEAWRQLAPRDAELWIAGGVGPRERALIPDLPGLRLLGRVPRAEVPALFAACDVFVLPSLFEGFGLVILEALAAGLPVIATPHTGAVEAVRSSALGRLVPVLDADALTEALRHYLQQPPDRPAVLAAAAAIRAEFTWQAYGDRWEKILRAAS
jgi:glycosyltransferase involved in cell wall biosynthesis